MDETVNKSSASIQEMLDEVDPDIGNEFRQMQRRPGVRLRKWWVLFRVRWTIRYNAFLCSVLGHDLVGRIEGYGNRVTIDCRRCGIAKSKGRMVEIPDNIKDLL